MIHRFRRENGTVPFAFSGENCPRRPVNGYGRANLLTRRVSMAGVLYYGIGEGLALPGRRGGGVLLDLGRYFGHDRQSLWL